MAAEWVFTGETINLHRKGKLIGVAVHKVCPTTTLTCRKAGKSTTFPASLP